MPVEPDVAVKTSDFFEKLFFAQINPFVKTKKIFFTKGWSFVYFEFFYIYTRLDKKIFIDWYILRCFL